MIILNNNLRYCRRKERNDLLIHSSVLGFAILFLIFAIYPLRPFIFAAIAFIIGKKNNEAIDLLRSSSVLMLGVNVFLTAIIFTFPFMLSAKLLKYNLSELISFKARKKTALPYILIALGFFAAGNVVTYITNIFFSMFGQTPQAPDFGAPKSVMELGFFILSGAIAPALFEEFAFRGIVLNALKKFGIWPAIIISSLLFALMHRNFEQIPFAFCAGIGLGVCYIKTNSIWPGVIAHFINNAFGITISSLGLPLAVMGLLNILFIVLMILAGVIGLSVYLVKHKTIFGFNDVPSCFLPITRVALIAVSPLMLLAIVLFLREAIGAL